eukprot:3933645-Rhodomonas_salina.2
MRARKAVRKAIMAGQLHMITPQNDLPGRLPPEPNERLTNRSKKRHMGEKISENSQMRYRTTAVEHYRAEARARRHVPDADCPANCTAFFFFWRCGESCAEIQHSATLGPFPLARYCRGVRVYQQGCTRSRERY